MKHRGSTAGFVLLLACMQLARTVSGGGAVGCFECDNAAGDNPDCVNGKNLKPGKEVSDSGRPCLICYTSVATSSTPKLPDGGTFRRGCHREGSGVAVPDTGSCKYVADQIPDGNPKSWKICGCSSSGCNNDPYVPTEGASLDKYVQASTIKDRTAWPGYSKGANGPGVLARPMMGPLIGSCTTVLLLLIVL
ncbi:hypothetical protein BV898_14370 [Hypsibius exemplaris]|uniref:Protein quiver n=1 Tax=Hypsibius exemplaris TaxID=2072580 RepID=A0A9X6N8M3_HYPEX|nr:hypothetical protein BV898_14370 [Hypsibius exemplaris]